VRIRAIRPLYIPMETYQAHYTGIVAVDTQRDRSIVGVFHGAEVEIDDNEAQHLIVQGLAEEVR
jgi:hypothetical protein